VPILVDAESADDEDRDFRATNGCAGAASPGAPHEDLSERDSVRATRLKPLTAETTMLFLATLAWKCNYKPAYEAERAAAISLLDNSVDSFVSANARRRTKKGGAEAEAVAQRSGRVVGDAFVTLQRSVNYLYVPFKQITTAAAWLFMCVSKRTWRAEQSARRIVDRKLATTLLKVMMTCRPPPPFEVNPLIASFAVDQTYVKSSGSLVTGTVRARDFPVISHDLLP